MKFTRYTEESGLKEKIEEAIAQFGFSPEHSYYLFRYYTDPDQRRVLFFSEEGYGVMAYEGALGAWELLSEPIAPEGRRGETLAALAGELFSSSETKEVSCELSTQIRDELLALLPSTLRATATKETLLWPVLDLHSYNPALPGPDFKSLRNAQNRFTREHQSVFADARGIEKQSLHALVDDWEKNRPATHDAYSREYHLMIDEGFAGLDAAYALVVDGSPEGIAGYWRVPNAASAYLSLALHSYRYWGLGEILMLESLRAMKDAGYMSADLGGSDGPLLAFKRNFGPMDTYETHQFSLVRA